MPEVVDTGDRSQEKLKFSPSAYDYKSLPKGAESSIPVCFKIGCKHKGKVLKKAPLCKEKGCAHNAATWLVSVSNGMNG